MKFRALFEKKFNVEKVRTSLINAEALLVYIKNEPKLKFKQMPNMSWKKSEFYYSGHTPNPEWTKFEGKKYSDFNGAEVVDFLISDGYDVTNVEIKSKKDI